MNALALLKLWEPDSLEDPAMRTLLERDLSAKLTGLRSATVAYRKLWQRVR